jgi:hypothetical protein
MITKEQFRKNKDRFEQAEAFEQVQVSYDQYHGYYHIVADKWVLERLENVAKSTASAIYNDLGIEQEEEND